MNIFHITLDAVSGIHITECGVFPTRDKHREVLLLGSDHPAVLGIDLETFLQIGRIKNPPKELMREKTLSLGIGSHPFLENHILNTAHGFHFRNAGIRDAIHVAGEQLLLIGRSEVSIVRNALVKIMRHQIEDVLLQVRSRANDAMNFSLTNHLREGNSQLSRAHGPGKRHEHDSALIQMAGISLCGILECCGVEMAIVEIDELRNRTLRHGG